MMSAVHVGVMVLCLTVILRARGGLSRQSLAGVQFEILEIQEGGMLENGYLSITAAGEIAGAKSCSCIYLPFLSI
jgi:hypothetical protein